MKLFFTWYLAFFLILISETIYSQNLSAYVDYRNYFHAFDNGEFRQIEYMPVRSYKLGGAGIAYISNSNEFMIYADRRKFDLSDASDLTYFATEYLISYRIGRVLYVFEKQRPVTLSYYCSAYFVNDSLAAYFDNSTYNFSVYYKENVITLESSLLEPPRSIKSGSNTLAYIDQSNYFKIFYQGETYVIDNVKPVAFETGRDVVAYIDDYQRNFHLFYKGDTATVEIFPPDSFKVGYGIAAYIDYLGNFMVFDHGTIRKVLSFRPDFFIVKGSMVVYESNNTLYVYYKGKIHTIENYIPKDMQVANDGLAYIDVGGQLKLFIEGKAYFVSYELINKYELYGNVLTYHVGTNTTKFFWQGKNY